MKRETKLDIIELTRGYVGVIIMSIYGYWSNIYWSNINCGIPFVKC